MTDREYIKTVLAKYDAYDAQTWIQGYFDEFGGGFNVYHIEHEFSETGGGGYAEKKVGKLLAKHSGKHVEFLPEGDGKQPDFLFDEQTWEVKYIDHANIKTIRGYIENARRKKADNCIFYWEITNKKYDLKSALNRELGKMSKLGRIGEMPDIYYMDESGLLKLLWEK